MLRSLRRSRASPDGSRQGSDVRRPHRDASRLPPARVTKSAHTPRLALLGWATFALSIGFALFVPSTVQAVPPDVSDVHCGPFEGPREFAQLGPSAEPGVAPAKPADVSTRNRDQGQIVNLATGGDAPMGQAAGEAILALPKDASGNVPTDFELAADATLAESFFSPVLCATLARVTGPADARPQDLVRRVPDSAALVPNHVYATAAGEIVPLDETLAEPDPYRPLQWGLDRTGVERARSVSDGRGVTVAILDSVPQVDHRDLGPIRVVRVEGGPGDAPGAHGTLVTGLVDAIPHNGFGIAGIAPGADIVAIPVCTPRGATASDACGLFTVLKGLDAAWNAEARLVNLSIVGPDNPLLERGMERLDSLGVLVVAASGNEGTDEPRYPAAYSSVIGVGAIDREGALYARSNRGRSAEILAPGVEVLSAVPGDAFSFGSGTSFAAAHVTGALAVLLGAKDDPIAARAALFRIASTRASSGAMVLPPVCDVLARLGTPCEGVSLSATD